VNLQTTNFFFRPVIIIIIIIIIIAVLLLTASTWFFSLSPSVFHLSFNGLDRIRLWRFSCRKLENWLTQKAKCADGIRTRNIKLVLCPRHLIFCLTLKLLHLLFLFEAIFVFK